MVRSVLVMGETGIQAEASEWIDVPVMTARRAAALADEPTPILDVRRSFPVRRGGMGVRTRGEVLSFGRPTGLPWDEPAAPVAPMPEGVDDWDDEDEITEILGLDELGLDDSAA